MELYRNLVLEHYRTPCHKGTLENPSFQSASHNPSCGDSVSFAGIIHDGTLHTVAFEGSGCVISQGAASLLAQKVKGARAGEVMALSGKDMLDLVQMELGPNRIRCALLALEALQQGIASYQEG